MRLGTKISIATGFSLAIIATIANIMGGGIDETTERYVIVMIFAYQLMTTQERD